MKESASAVPVERISQRIFLIRGQKVMLSTDLAELYGIPAKVLIQAVKRNAERFPDDFMFRVDSKEVATLKSQFVTSKSYSVYDKAVVKLESRGAARKVPYAFTEQGVAIEKGVATKRHMQWPRPGT